MRGWFVAAIQSHETRADRSFSLRASALGFQGLEGISKLQPSATAVAEANVSGKTSGFF